MATERRLIDANALREEAHWIIRSDGTRVFAIHADDVDNAPTVDAVPEEKYNALKEQYERVKEIADILDTALRQYQRQYGE